MFSTIENQKINYYYRFQFNFQTSDERFENFLLC